MESEKSFFESLFDFSFTYFITSKIIKFLYGLSIAGSGILALVLVIGGFNMAPGIGILTLLILAPLTFLVSVIYTRVMLEIVIAIFRISEHAAEIARQGRGGTSHSPSS